MFNLRSCCSVKSHVVNVDIRVQICPELHQKESVLWSLLIQFFEATGLFRKFVLDLSNIHWLKNTQNKIPKFTKSVNSHLKNRVREFTRAADMDKMMFAGGLLHVGRVLEQPELVCGDGAAEPGRGRPAAAAGLGRCQREARLKWLDVLRRGVEGGLPELAGVARHAARAAHLAPRLDRQQRLLVHG